MIPDKPSVKSSFSTSAVTYDEYSGLQSNSADELLNFAQSNVPRQFDNLATEASMILDAGCGTGLLAPKLRMSGKRARICAIDIALPMVEKTKSKAPDCKHAASDFDALCFKDETFDAIISNLAYQWSANLELSFAEARRVLKKGGLFLIATLGSSTLKELRECYPDKDALVSFSAIEDVRGALTNSGLDEIKAESMPLKRAYPDFLALIEALRRTGAVPKTDGASSMQNALALRKTKRFYDAKYADKDGGVYATYELILIAAVRKD